MATLAQQIAELRQRIQALPVDARPAELTPLETEARALLTASKNTSFEDEAKALLSELARRSAPPVSETASIRSMIRRARIRMEMAAGDDDFDEAIDILSEALAQDSTNSDVLALLNQAALRSPQHEMKVRDLLNRYGIAFELEPGPAIQSYVPPASASDYTESESNAQLRTMRPYLALGTLRPKLRR